MITQCDPDNVVRKRLIMYREIFIWPRYMDIPRESGILRRRMVDLLLSYRPTTEAEFYERIPQEEIDKTDPDQLDELPAILVQFAGRRIPRGRHLTVAR